jgi:hypothetical protein
MDDSRDGIEIFGQEKAVDDASGEKLTLRPLGLSDYGSAREEALNDYRRQEIAVWSKNIDLIPEASREAWIRDAFENAAKIKYEDLPQKQIEEVDDGENSLPAMRVEYGLWWMSSTPAGMLYSLWLSAKKDPGQSSITKEEVEHRFMQNGMLNESLLEKAAQTLGELSEPKIAGNGGAPPSAGQKRRERRRRKRKQTGRS